MRLLGWQGEVLGIGSGIVRLDTFGDFDFGFEGHSTDRQQFCQFTSYQQRNPYEGQARLRLVVVDQSGEEIHCGYTVPENLSLGEGTDLRCSGSVDGLHLDAPACANVGTEVLFFIPEQHWLSTVLAVSFPPPDEHGRSSHSMELLGSSLEFEYEPQSRSLTISIIGNASFPQTYTEGWLGEPLRMMIGQLIFPRIYVRANPDCAMVMVSQNRLWHHEADAYSLLEPALTFEKATQFFDMYAEILTFVATARDEEGNPNLERHPLTGFYDELAQAMRGSRWIMTLILASAVEGVLDLLSPGGAKDKTANLAEINDLKQYIDRWTGHTTSSKESIASLKDRAKGAVSRTAELTAIKRLRLLAAQQMVTREEVNAWEAVRNRVAHGKVFSPFSTAQNDRLIINLMSLFRRLAGRIALSRNPASTMFVRT